MLDPAREKMSYIKQDHVYIMNEHRGQVARMMGYVSGALHYDYHNML